MLLTAEQLAEKTKTELIALAGELEIEILTPAKVKKDEIVASIVAAQAARSGLEMASGILDVLPEGYGFLRRAGYVIGNDDIYVSQSQ
ncbi:MAG: Rho termination factor N-terminal domain-containing protein, partial [Candidatus Tumulicola sp.]